MKKQKVHNKNHKNKEHVGVAPLGDPQKRNTQKGITLIALIITIIVLLILAVVSIRLVVNNGILGKAESGVSKYQEAEADEQAQLLKAEYEMAKYEGKATGTFTDYVLETKYNGVEIGDYVVYTPSDETYTSLQGSENTSGEYYESVPNIIEQGSGYSEEQTFNTKDYTGGWRVLGVDETTLDILLISADNITTSTGSNYCLKRYTGATYGEKELNNICEIYGKGKYATGARSVNVNDVNKITGYNPERTGDGTPYNNGTISEYGNEVIYTWKTSSDTITYLGVNGISGISGSSSYPTVGFNYHDEDWNWRSIAYSSESEICILKSTCYQYYPYSLTTSSSTSGTQVGISITSPEYYTLFCNSSNKTISYWLASPYVRAWAYAEFGFFCIWGRWSGLYWCL